MIQSLADSDLYHFCQESFTVALKRFKDTVASKRSINGSLYQAIIAQRVCCTRHGHKQRLLGCLSLQYTFKMKKQ